MITPRLFRLEFAVAVSVCWLLAQRRSHFAHLGGKVALLHCLLILLFAEIGTAGLHSLIWFCSGNAKFLAAFRNPNLLSLPSDAMYWIAAIYGIMCSVFFCAVMSLGMLSRRGRGVFLALVFPSTVLYPVIMGNLTGTSDILTSLEGSPEWIMVAFALVAGCGSAFYYVIFRKQFTARRTCAGK